MQAFRSELIEGLSAVPKSISPKWLYDAKGSELFEDITQLPEYYPTRQEMALLTSTIPQWRQAIGEDAVLVELGSGASEKTRIVLDAIPEIKAYVPLDISKTALEQASASLKSDYPQIDIRPVLGDFANLPDLPPDLPDGRRVGFFPGSTIGNLEREEARHLLESSRRMLGEGALFILGVDLIKDEDVLVAAYDDAAGVTAEFNLNLLERANRELGADFDITAFRHRAVWNDGQSRMEMHLEALRPQTVKLGDHEFAFEKGESLHTESSRKFDRRRVDDLAGEAGWKTVEWVESPAPSVALALLEAC
ncbi:MULTISPECIES: L-histidine N(alpha)-methyltransferase [unclassified Brevundimonas]|uniref:L-histidine N(alpha)-methyltransferase n=1 Tax=unclassified Brevundimonas TaxID=2622653 RepID=UPI0028A0411A|nr:L-histidine N(alpha)-methyltransferase [Brevundimonas sp.]